MIYIYIYIFICIYIYIYINSSVDDEKSMKQTMRK